LAAKLPGVILANDATLTVSAAYGRRQGEVAFPQPATFIIDSAGLVRFIHLASDAEEWPSIQNVRDALSRMAAAK
jgi:peroxiredoxin